jgi:ABC-2 type transport system permease protein
MSTVTAGPAPVVPASVPATAPVKGKVTQLRVLKSEWIKLRTLRSTPITLVVAVVAMVGLGILTTYLRASHPDRHGVVEHINGAEASLAMYRLAQLAVGVLGVLVISGEYTTGMIRASLSAVPKRLPVLWAKAAVYGAVVLVLMTVAALVAFYGGQAVLKPYNLAVHMSDPGVTRVVFGTALYLTVVGLLGVGFGALIRNSAGAIAALFGVLLILPELADLLPSSWDPDVIPYLPSSAGQAVLSVAADPTMMSPWNGFALFVGYALALLAVAAVLLRRRDA